MQFQVPSEFSISIPDFDSDVIARATRGATRRPFEQHFFRDSPVYAKMRCMKVVYGRDENVDAHFKTARANYSSDQKPSSPISPTAVSPDPASSKPEDAPPSESSSTTAATQRSFNLLSFSRAFSDINVQLPNHPFGDDKVKTFLDLGFSPGGFSSWLIDNNPLYRGGLGVTLPDTRATYTRPDENRVWDARALRSRSYEMKFGDINEFVEGCINEGKEPWINLKDHSDTLGTGLGTRHEGYDLVIAGAFPTLEGRIPILRRAQLALSQLYIALTNTRPGGSCVMVCNTKTFSWILEIIGVLRRAFESVTALKGKLLHSTRSSCYLVCQGFRRRIGDGDGGVGNSEGTDVDEYKQRVRDVLGWIKKRLAETEAGFTSKASQESENSQGEESGGDSDGEEVEEDQGTTGPATHMSLLPEYADADALYEGEHPALLKLFEPIWESQCRAMEEHMRRLCLALLPYKIERDDQRGIDSE